MAKLRRIDEDEAEDDLESQIWDESSGGDTAKEEDQTKKTSQSSKEVKADLAPPRIRKMSSDVSDKGVFLPDRFNKRRLLRNLACIYFRKHYASSIFILNMFFRDISL